jgi:hypothetical protein
MFLKNAIKILFRNANGYQSRYPDSYRSQR